jgi:hypothetical protein
LNILNRVDDGKNNIYVDGYIALKMRKVDLKTGQAREELEKMTLRKIKFEKNAKDKISKFYVDFNRYLTESYYLFETQTLKGRQSTPSVSEWLKFQKVFRREYTSSKVYEKTQPIMFEIAKALV